MTRAVTLTRFAPAPTGWLHLGHVANAIYVWGLARLSGASVLLRIEDHDRQRSRPEYERGILDDLEWLGFEPDVYPPSTFRHGPSPSRQSDRTASYRDVADALAQQGRVYGCRCSRRDLDGTYHGTCRELGIALTDDVAWRVAIDDGIETFDDVLCGAIVQRPRDQCGDIVIRDRLGNWTYQFVAAVDDHLQGIDFVVRGEDLLESTGRQMAIARLAGRAEPARFAHHPLIMRTPNQKLSKSDGATAIAAMRAGGSKPEVVIADAARRVGLVCPEPITAHDVAAFFLRLERRF